MVNTLFRFFSAALFALLGLIGMMMALVFMASTAIAVGVLYLVAKVRGKPFGVRGLASGRARPAGHDGGLRHENAPPG
ncbi:hypothetical protein OMF39_19930, partial [Bordetella pertussis]